ncbi:hypothetical protein [Kalamiella sp. sgz302252]|uniref:hypothetical protein n=1 Tax=Pantoea sp. sgz302252 TaxID=3341827 RepID=UPI0036D42AD9
MTCSINSGNINRLGAFNETNNIIKNSLGKKLSDAKNVDNLLRIRGNQTQHANLLVHNILSKLQSARSVNCSSTFPENLNTPVQTCSGAESAVSTEIKAETGVRTEAGAEKPSSSALAQLSTALRECPSHIEFNEKLRQAAIADLAADVSATKSVNNLACSDKMLEEFITQIESSDNDEIAQKNVDDFLIMRYLIKNEGLDGYQIKELNKVTKEFIVFIRENGLGEYSAAAGSMGKDGDKESKLKKFNGICNKLAAINEEKKGFTLNNNIAQEIDTTLTKHIPSKNDREAVTKNEDNFFRASYRDHSNMRRTILRDNSTGLFDQKRTLFNHESLVLDLLKKPMDKIADTDNKDRQKPAAAEQTPKVNAGEAQPGIYAPFVYIDNSIHYHYGAQPAMANSGEKASDQKDKLLNQFADAQTTTNVLPKGEINQDQDLISGLDETDDVGGSYDEQPKVYAFADNTGDKLALKQAEGGTTEELQETLSEHLNNETPVSDSVSFSVQPKGNPTQPLSVSEPQEVHQAVELQTASDEIRQEGGVQNDQQPEKVPDRHINSPLADSPQNTPKRSKVMMGNSAGTQTSGSQIVRERNNKSGQNTGEVQTNESAPSDENQGLDRWGRRTYLQQQSESEKANGRSGYQRSRQATPNVVSTNGVAGDIAGRFNNSTGLATQRTSEPSANGETPVNLAQNVRQSDELMKSNSVALQTADPHGKQGDANTVYSRFIDKKQSGGSATQKTKSGIARLGNSDDSWQPDEKAPQTEPQFYLRKTLEAQVMRNPAVADGDEFAGRDSIMPVRSSQLQNSASVYQQPVQKRGDMLNDRRTDEVQTNTSAAPKDNQGLDRWGRRTYLQQQSESEKATGRSGYQRSRQATPNVVSTNGVAGDIAGRFNHNIGLATQRTIEPSANGERPVNLAQNVGHNNEVAPSTAQNRITPVRSPQLQNSVSAVQQPVQKRGGMLNDRRIGEVQTATGAENKGLDTRGRRTYLQQQSESEKATGRSGYRRNRQASPNVVSANGVAGDITRRFTNSRSLAPLKASEASTNGEAHTDSSLVTRSWTGESAELKTTSEKERPENRNDIHHPEQEMQRSEPQFYRRKISKAQVMQNPAIAESDDFAGQGKPMLVQS